MSDPGLALQKALFEKLSTALATPVFDAVPANTPYPYVTLDYETVDNTTPVSGKKRENRLLSPEYLLSVERWPFHSEPPDHYDLLSYLLEPSLSQSS